MINLDDYSQSFGPNISCSSILEIFRILQLDKKQSTIGGITTQKTHESKGSKC